MRWMTRIAATTAAVMMGTAAMAAAPAALEKEIQALYRGWADVEYGTKESEAKQKKLEPLMAKAEALSTQYPDRAEPLIWSGILLGTQAQAVGGTGALSWAEKAKAQLEKAEKVDADALEGAGLTTLGTLYDKVPGWPIGFGSSSKARDYLQRAVKQSPNAMEANYFYASFLYGQGQYRDALNALDNAKQPPAGITSGLGVDGRKDDIETLRNKAKRSAR